MGLADESYLVPTPLYILFSNGIEGFPRNRSYFRSSNHKYLYDFRYVFFTPSLAVKVRRLRDAGLHWAFIFLHFVPMGGIALLVLLAMPTKEVEIVTIDRSKEVEAEEVSPFE